MVFALETFWPAATGGQAARIEEQLVVTKDGCEVITRFPAEELPVTGRCALHRRRRGCRRARGVTSNLNNPTLVDAVVGSAAYEARSDMPADVIMPALGMAQESGQGAALAQAGRRRGRQGRAAARDRDRQGDGRDRVARRRARSPASARPRATEVPVGTVIAVVLARRASRGAGGRAPGRPAPAAAAAPALASPKARRLAAGARRVDRGSLAGQRSRTAPSRRGPVESIAARGAGERCRDADGESFERRDASWRVDGRANDALAGRRCRISFSARRRRDAARELACAAARKRRAAERRQPHRSAREARAQRHCGATPA